MDASRAEPLVWASNTLRNRIRQTWLGRRLLSGGAGRTLTIHLVSATRLGESAFWADSALGRSLAPWRDDPQVSAEVRFSNTEGLPAVYNRALMNPSICSDILVFVHDDVWLADPQWTDKLRDAVTRFDVVGVAGNTRRSPHQPAWLWRGVENHRLVWDDGYLSGAIRHGPGPDGALSDFGPSPARCELLDGVFLAVRNKVARQSRLGFDEQFTFDFYDLDLCRSARAKGLSLGTWPIDIVHASAGAFGSEGWLRGHATYMAKWRS